MRCVKAACVLLSGGLDSAALLFRALQSGARVLPVYVRCGFVWEQAELYWVRRLLKALAAEQVSPLQVVELPMRSLYGAHWSLTGKGIPQARSRDAAVFLPGRNALLLTAAAIAAYRGGAGCIAIGVLRGNPFGDATPRFFRKLAASLGEALGRPLQIIAPLGRLSKTQLIRSSRRLPLGLTFSCINPKLRYYHCGRCNKCAERKRAFRQAAVADPTRYIA